MTQRYLDTSVRRIPIRVHKRTFEEGGANRRKPKFTPIPDVSMAAFKTKGGTPSITDGVLSVISTGEVVITYRDDVKRGDRVECLADGSMWDVLHVENIDMQFRDARLIVQAVEGVA